VVISPIKSWSCNSCGGTGELLIMEGPGPVCLQLVGRQDAGASRHPASCAGVVLAGAGTAWRRAL
jgi:hypothetical protein